MEVHVCDVGAGRAWAAGLWVRPTGAPDWRALDVRDGEVVLAPKGTTRRVRRAKCERGKSRAPDGTTAVVIRPIVQPTVSRALEWLALGEVVLLRADTCGALLPDDWRTCRQWEGSEGQRWTSAL